MPCSDTGVPMRTTRRTMPKSMPGALRIHSRFLAVNASTVPAMPNAMIVASAAPRTSSPKPKISRGSRTMLRPSAKAIARSGRRMSPRPLYVPSSE